MEQSHLQLASGEKVIRSCDYRIATGKKYERVDSYMLTNKRLISRTNERIKDRTTIDAYEVPVEQIDTVKTFYRDDKPPIPLAVILFAVILIVGAVAAFIADAAIFGFVMLGVCALMLLISIFSRKRRFVFTLDVGRLIGRDTNEHMTTGSSSVKSASVNEGDRATHSRRKIDRRSLTALIASIALITFAALFIANIDAISRLEGDISASSWILPLGCIVGLLVSLFVLCAASAKKNGAHGDRRKSSRKVKATPTASKAEMPVEEIKKFLDEVGALVQNIKTTQNKTTKEI